MTAEIISIGDELLIGQTINTNASWLAGELYDAGNCIIHKTILTHGIGESFLADTMHGIVSKLLKEKYHTLSVAESCTGGMISHLLTSIPGASQYFKGSIVAYDNEIKIGQLNVDRSLIEKHGAVSSHVVEAMAKGIRELFNTDYALATTGIAGPEGGTAKKPVGMVWIALAKNNDVKSKKFLFGNNRERNILISSIAALNLLRKDICK